VKTEKTTKTTKKEKTEKKEKRKRKSKKNSSGSDDKAHHLSNIVHSGALDSGSVEFIPSDLPILAGPTSVVMHIDPKLGPVMVPVAPAIMPTPNGKIIVPLPVGPAIPVSPDLVPNMENAGAWGAPVDNQSSVWGTSPLVEAPGTTASDSGSGYGGNGMNTYNNMGGGFYNHKQHNHHNNSNSSSSSNNGATNNKEDTTTDSSANNNTNDFNSGFGQFLNSGNSSNPNSSNKDNDNNSSAYDFQTNLNSNKSVAEKGNIA
jgi:hypothetical protein